MNEINKILETVDEYKEKMRDADYKTIMDSLMILQKRNNRTVSLMNELEININELENEVHTVEELSAQIQEGT